MAGQLKECNWTELILMHSKVQLAVHVIQQVLWSTANLENLLRESLNGEKKTDTEAFDELKNMISSDKVQAYFDPEATLERHVNRSPMGLAATLTRKRPGEQE